MKQKVFITKFALTSGIKETELVVTLNDIHFKKKCYGEFQGHRQGFYNDEFHLTVEEATNDAEKRGKKKIESLEKKILKLKSMSFQNI